MPDHDPAMLLEMLQDERVSNRRRETFLLSAIVHLMLVLLIVTNPDLFKNLENRLKPDAELVPVKQRELTMLYAPPSLPKLKSPPKTEILSDANRRAQRGLERPPVMSYQPPPQPAPAPNPGPPPSPRTSDENKIARALPQIGIPDFPERPKEPPRQRPSLETVPPRSQPPPSSRAELTMPELAPPSGGTDAILRGLAKEHASGRGTQGGGGGFPDINPHDPNLNIPGPQILSDTMGVDFNPYLLRILSIVRRNWYAVIPEIARLGRPGRVVLQFSINRNGGVADMDLAAGSGTDSLDGAAVSSIRLSNPFPPLPPEFPGQDIKLRFIYLYNLPVNY